MYVCMYLSVGALQEGVEVGETRGSLVLEAGEQSLLHGPELQGLTAHHLSTLVQVTPQLQTHRE